MKQSHVLALFEMAGFEVRSMHELKDGYITERGWPWWLVLTAEGPIKIGWRKRVIHFEWPDTGLRTVLTTDDVTKSETMQHAYGYVPCLQYLATLREAFRERQRADLANPTRLAAIDAAVRAVSKETQE